MALDVIVVDASALFEVLKGTGLGHALGSRFEAADVLAAPSVIDVEVLGVVRRQEQTGQLDLTAANQAAEDLATWPADRYPHEPLIARAWELRHNVRTWDAFYVALAEALDATLLTTDGRLAAATGPTCAIEVADR